MACFAKYLKMNECVPEIPNLIFTAHGLVFEHDSLPVLFQHRLMPLLLLRVTFPPVVSLPLLDHQNLVVLIFSWTRPRSAYRHAGRCLFPLVFLYFLPYSVIQALYPLVIVLQELPVTLSYAGGLWVLWWALSLWFEALGVVGDCWDVCGLVVYLLVFTIGVAIHAFRSGV